MDQSSVQALFRQFAAPLAGYTATSPERKISRRPILSSVADFPCSPLVLVVQTILIGRNFCQG